ncbi:sarcosine oxidase subunit gamma [Sulfitobacter albidus]|uniref:Sarcosine oxidase subunit gamma n=1 Tax=Sulfitobacter albidus TaxID=2829501 RepID=A0A975JB55_9RHOB|nr:sarcosine oxidase subunit gamma family protein [Sulfitobacter albidus]QUJ75196.1 sarcosine oxidase subunit gamma [Sulfitobacter albidus]
MVELKAQSPAADLLPLEIGGIVAREVDPGEVCSSLPFRRSSQAQLDAALGATFPGPGQWVQSGAARAVWAGQGEVLLMGAAAPAALGDHAALVDQSDMWCVVELAGAGVEDVLARLVPLDLRAGAFPVGSATRSLLGHMHALIIRTGDETFEVAVFRSLAGTLVHDLRRALEAVAARG